VGGTDGRHRDANERSQITGQLVKIAFKQGQAVKKGDLLGEIDPSPTKLAQQKSIATQTADSQKAIVDSSLP
jgi:membrane fusion protein, multidrug efflux system